LVRNRSGRIVTARDITATDDQDACRIAARIPDPGDQAAIWDQCRRVGLVDASRTPLPARPPFEAERRLWLGARSQGYRIA
jgi:hypothetical protein